LRAGSDEGSSAAHGETVRETANMVFMAEVIEL
jgi:hypothetical protein